MDEYLLDAYFDFTFATQTPATGAATDADALPTYRVYEEGNDTAVATGNCAKRDDANTTGYYAARAQVTTAAGYEVGKTYEVRVVAIMATVSGSAVVGRFRVVPADTVRDDVWTDARAGYLTTLNTCLTGITSLAAWLRLLGRKDTGDSTAKSELNAGGGEYSEATDSLEAIRDRGDAAWDTATGFSTFDPATQQVDIGAVKGTPVSSVDDFKANVSGLATSNEIADLQTHGDTEWAKVSAEDVDAQLSLTHGSGSWLTSNDDGVHTVTVTVQTSGGTTFEGVRVGASGLDETNQYVKYTDTAGQVVFHLDDGEWRFIAAGTGAQSGGYVDATVDAASDVVLIVTAVALPDPAPAGYCTVYARGQIQNGNNAVGTFRVAALRSPQIVDEDGEPVALFLGDDSPALVNGTAQVQVLQGAVVSFVLSTSTGTTSRENVTVPSETGPVNFLRIT